MPSYLLTIPLILISLGIFLALALRKVPINNPQAGLILAWFPAASFASLLYLASVANGKELIFSVPWMPSLGLNFSFYLDGLSALFALLITGIGTLVIVYSGYYFEHEPQAKEKEQKKSVDGHSSAFENRFFIYILLFMLAMLGLVLAGDLITLFLFWEGTSISSFLLIAYKFKDEAARKGAFKSLFITGGGGIAMLAGFLFVISISGSADFKTILTSGDMLRASPLYPLLFALIALGAFTKSAQFPAHIWLPEAMSAPTPASSFLHSATMVKAGIYLLARLNPSLGGTDLWFWTLSIFGLTTMLVGAYLGAKQNDIKPLLAYSTISQLGVLVALIGQDTEIAFKALVISIFAHALYKSALFMSAGIIDHETGTRDLRKLGGLRKQMPVMFGIMGIAGLSMAGLPPLFGFLAKETLLASATHPNLPAVVDLLFPLTTILAGALILFQAGILFWGVFLGQPADPKHPPHGHDPKLGFWLAPAIPALISLLVGITPVEPKFLAEFLAWAAKSAYGDKVKVSLALWTGINVPLMLSVVAVSLGLLLFWQRGRIRLALIAFLPNLTLNALFDGVISGLDWLSKTATRLQGGQLRVYLRIMVLAAVGLVLLFGGIPSPSLFQNLDWRLEGLDVLRVFSLILLVGAALLTVFLRRDLYAVIALGVVGLGVAIWMALDPSPDVALVQVVVDILSTVILVLALGIIPRKLRDRANELLHTRTGRARDWLIAGLAGLVIAMVSFTALETRPRMSLVSPYYIENSKPLTGAKDIVGAIVVDFRGADTMIEIMVFAMAGLGIYTLLHYAARKDEENTHRPAVMKNLPANAPLGVYHLPTSPLLHTLAYMILPLAFLLGVTHMMYGHDQPGDGFTAGVIISLAIAMWYMLFGYSEARRKLGWLRRRNLISAGLGLALLNALGGLPFGAGFFAPVDYGKMLGLPLPPGFGLTNSFFFEMAICLTVIGAATLILDNLGYPREADPEADAELAAVELEVARFEKGGMEVEK
ncbi:MAG: monovalent cation/H+ antiporter subunit A [Chloroflexi bacterium HGW-Chloroflexi-6]|nr:MAG: monovalent cation/H+ antiporter subunit A [Chloroflexi bacterium HGW-Chloroflexi-6]